MTAPLPTPTPSSPPAPRQQAGSAPAYRISSAAEALEVARALAGELGREASERDRDRRLPWAELDALSRSGLLAITVPKAAGGADVDSGTVAEVIAILAEADASIGQIPQNHFYLLEALRVDGSEVQQARYHAQVLAGARFGNALAELGTPTALDIRTRIRPQADGSWRLDGHKAYSTGALFAHWIGVQTLDEQDRSWLAIVPHDAAGLERVDDWLGFGQRTTGSGSTHLDQVRVETDALIPHYRGFERPTRIGPFGQLVHAGIDLGIARAALADTLQFVREHSRPWKDAGVTRARDDPYVIARIGGLDTALSAAQALLRRAGRQVDAIREAASAEELASASVAVAEAKIATTRIALEASQSLFELAGSQSTLQAYNLDRHWRNARTHTLHDPLRWKYRLIGNYLLNHSLPPRHGSV